MYANGIEKMSLITEILNDAHKKAGTSPAFYVAVRLRLHRLDLGIQTALVTSSLVLVDNAFAYHAIDNRYRFQVGFLGIVFVASGDFVNHFLDVCANHGAQTGIVSATLFSLACTLLS